MKHINLLMCSSIRELPEWDQERFPKDKYDIQIDSKDDIIWDMVVVRQDLPYPYSFRCKEGNVIYINSEPPSSIPLTHSFTEQFDFVIVQNPRVKHKNMEQCHGYEPWSMGRSFSTNKNRFFYKELSELNPKKSRSISIITSNKTSQPGHIKRVDVINRLMKDFPGEIDFYGKGHNYIDVKADALLPYRFHICIENAFIPNCWTEKFADPVLAQCVPIYAGCTNIEKYFGEEGYVPFDIEDYNSLKFIVKKILQNPEEEYNKYLPGLRRLRKTLMEKENIIPFVINYLEQHPSNMVHDYYLKPMAACRGFKVQFNILRLKRLLFKIYYVFYKLFR